MNELEGKSKEYIEAKAQGRKWREKEKLAAGRDTQTYRLVSVCLT